MASPTYLWSEQREMGSTPAIPEESVKFVDTRLDDAGCDSYELTPRLEPIGDFVGIFLPVVTMPVQITD